MTFTTLNKLERKKKRTVHVMKEVVECTVTDVPFTTHTGCSKCPPFACLHFLTRVTTELATLRSTSVLLMLLAVLRICCSSFLVFPLCAYTKLFTTYALKPSRLIVRSGLDVPTFATRCLCACHHARAPSGGRWNCGQEMSGNFA